ncbi:MAG TPA: tetratricopeptide repeat protein, partial [Egibacteraceae bacterium]|nr:tetratricopeptide repeat protein [Egibacteraceae bacterium]
VPLALYGALTHTWTTPWRVVSALLAVAALGAQLASDSLQGPLASVVGSTLVLTVWLFSTEGRMARRRVPILAAGLSAVTAASVAFLAGVGPLGALRDQAYVSFRDRTGHWGTAVNMAAERPLLGYGLGSFGDWAFRFRPEWFALRRALTRSADSVHSVPLEMLANGGAVLLLGYLAFVGLAAWAVVHGLRRLSGEERLLVGGFGGAWLAYHTQSLLSIDVPPLAALHFVLAGVLVARGLAPRWREVRLPGAPAAAAVSPGKTRKKKRAAVPLVPLNPGLVAVIVVGSVALVWVGTTPLRADLAAQTGRNLAAAGDTRAADAAFERASRTAFWEARYPALHAVLFTDMGKADLARDAYRTAVAREPRGLAHALNLARVSVSLGEHEEAGAWYARALELDPTTPETLAEVGRYKVTQGENDEAQVLLERATAVREDNADWWVALGQARSADGDEEGARAAFQRALDIDPGAEGAEQALEELAARD